MVKLRTTTRQSIYDALENTYFTASSFEIKYHENKKDFLDVIFIPQPEFNFKGSKNSSYGTNGNWITSEAPGVHLREAENFHINNFSSIIKHLKEWADRILEDYRLDKKESFDEFQEFQKQIEIKVNATSNDKSELFTSEEANALKDTLDNLYSKFESLSEENKELKARLNSIRDEINNIKSDVECFPKNAWYRISGNKIVKLMKDVAITPEARKLIAETARKYLVG